MFSPNRKRPDLGKNGTPAKESAPMTRETKRRLGATVGLTVVLMAIWFGCMGAGMAKAVMIAYFAVFGVLLLAYLIYNRGFVNKDVTAEMLPADWSEETKQAILDHCRKNVAKYAMPCDVEFRDEMPKTLVGKVAYRVLEEDELAKMKAQEQSAS